MSDDGFLPTIKNAYRDVVTPVKRRRTRGTMYEDEFSHGEVHIDGHAPEALPDDAEVEVEFGRLFYRYPGKEPIMVTEDGAHRYKDSREKDAETQAFFVLSMLDADGKVSRWSQK